MKEEFKPICGFEHYSVSNTGKCRSEDMAFVRKNGRKFTRKGTLLKYYLNKDGYRFVDLYKNKKRYRFMIHRLVYSTFVGDIDKNLVIDHIDHNKENNNLDNLQQISHRENISKDSVQKSGLLGAYKVVNSNKYSSCININKKSFYLGVFDTKEEANRAYNNALNEYINNKTLPTRVVVRQTINGNKKYCTKCNKLLSLSEFYYNKRNGYQCKCKDCFKKDRRERYFIKKNQL